MNLKLKAYNCIATPDRVQMIRSNMYRLVNIVGSDGKIVYVAGGYPKNIWNEYLEQRIDELNISIDGTIAIINDIALEAVNRLMMKGYHNFVIVGTDESLLQKINRSVNIVYYYDKENVTIETCLLGDLKSMGKEFDLIISNPPYAIGNEITKTIIDNINFREFVNLMPLTAYKKNDLYNYVDITNDVYSFTWSTEQAMVSTSISYLKSTKQNNIPYDEFMLNSYSKKYEKFYFENYRRQQGSTSGIGLYKYNNPDWLFAKGKETGLEEMKNLLNDFIARYKTTSFMMGMRTAQNGVHRTSNCFDYKWNVSKEATVDDFTITWDSSMKGYHLLVTCIFFNSAIEKENFTKFWYNGKLMNLLILGLNKTGGPIKAALPDVDWTREWTDEQILQEFGYTEEEIQNILND